jgi:hypothetical protein
MLDALDSRHVAKMAAGVRGEKGGICGDVKSVCGVEELLTLICEHFYTSDMEFEVKSGCLTERAHFFVFSRPYD